MSALFGGVLIGLAAALLLWAGGRIAGISGIVGRLWIDDEPAWRIAFIGGLLAGAAVFAWLRPDVFAATAAPVPLLAFAGLLVGTGTQLANGCTSGHGVCGIGRFSRRSIAATLTFMLVAMATTWVAR